MKNFKMQWRTNAESRHQTHKYYYLHTLDLQLKNIIGNIYLEYELLSTNQVPMMKIS
jgi:hypothetical protein